jgi:hypothetical protein
MLLEFLIFLVLPVLIDVLLIEIVLSGRYKRRYYLLIPEILPGEILEPWVLLDLGRTVFPQPIDRLTLNHLKKVRSYFSYFIYEVCGFEGPTLWDLVFLDLYLLGEDLIANFLS